jgi:hypothetical protein
MTWAERTTFSRTNEPLKAVKTAIDLTHWWAMICFARGAQLATIDPHRRRPNIIKYTNFPSESI